MVNKCNTIWNKLKLNIMTEMKWKDTAQLSIWSVCASPELTVLFHHLHCMERSWFTILLVFISYFDTQQHAKMYEILLYTYVMYVDVDVLNECYIWFTLNWIKYRMNIKAETELTTHDWGQLTYSTEAGQYVQLDATTTQHNEHSIHVHTHEWNGHATIAQL